MLKNANTRALSRHLLLSGAAPAATGILIILLSTNYISSPTWEAALVTVGSVLLGVGVFDVIFRLVAFQHFVGDLSSTVLRALKLPVRAFYESRSQLDSVERELAGVEELWATWHVGPYRDLEAFFPEKRRGRILLTHPSSSALDELCKIRKGDVHSTASVIRSITKHALEKNIEVRWFNGPVFNNVIIADPQKDRAWMRVELVIPYRCPQRRPSFLVGKDGNDGLYETFFSSYEKMWAAAEIPDVSSLAVEREKVAVG